MSQLPPASPTPEPKPAWYRRRWVQVVAGIFVLLLVVGALAPEEQPDKETASTEQQTTEQPKPVPEVELALKTPTDGQTVRRGRVTFVGTVTPGSEVTVDGRAATVASDGTWRRPVNLDLGDNDVTIEASAPNMTETDSELSVRRVRSAAERKAFQAAQARKAAERAARKRAARAAAKQNYIASAKSIPYKQLIKDADAYKGTKVVFRGQIMQIQQDGDWGGMMLLSVTDEGYGFWTDNVWVDYDKAIGAAEDDIITVYGKITGSKSYETQIGGETYVPQMHARYFG